MSRPLSKAFDSVNHEILLRKIKQLRIDTYLFDSYLSERPQSVRLGKHVSGKLNVSFGVPQGSVFSPLMFLIYVNDLSKYISDCLVIQYADNTQFVHTGNVSYVLELIKKGEETLKKAKRYFFLERFDAEHHKNTIYVC